MGAADGEVDGGRRPGVIGSVTKALDLLQLFAGGREIQVNRAARELGISKSTVHRLLATLAIDGYVEQDPVTRAYRPGPALTAIGLAALERGDLPAAPVSQVRAELAHERRGRDRAASGSGTRPIDELIFEIFRVNDRLLSVGDAAVKDFGLTSARWLVLGAIALAETPLTVAQIARNMGLTRQAVQRLTNEMSALGLVELQDNPNHRRARVVLLTETGAEAYEAALARWRAEWTAQMEEILPGPEIVETTRRLRRLRSLLQSRPRSA